MIYRTTRWVSVIENERVLVLEVQGDVRDWEFVPLQTVSRLSNDHWRLLLARIGYKEVPENAIFLHKTRQACVNTTREQLQLSRDLFANMVALRDKQLAELK